MTVKELFRKVENLNKTKKELGLGDEEVQIEVQFDGYNVLTFNSFNQLCDYITNEYVEEYVDNFLNTEVVKEYNYFKMYFTSNNEKEEIMVNIFNY